MADVKVRMYLGDSNNSYIDIDKNNGLKSVESLSQSTGQPKEVFYGCVPSSGKVEIVDVNGEILKMIEDGTLQNSNVPIDLIINGRVAQKHITNDSDYNSNTKNFTVFMTNNILDWDNITYGGKPLEDREQSAYEIVFEIMTSLGYSEDKINNKILSSMLVYGNTNEFGTIKDYLQTIKIPYPYLTVGTYRETIDKICQIAQLQLFNDFDGTPIFISARPITSKLVVKNAIHIPRKYMNGNLERTIILKNKYDGVDMEEMVVSRVVVNDANCGSAFSTSVGYETQSDYISIGRKVSDRPSASTYLMSLKLYFKTFDVEIPAKTNNNLNTTYKIKDFSSIVNVGDNLLVDDIKTYSYLIQSLNTTISISPSIYANEFGGSNIDQERITSVNYDSLNDKFLISLVACVGRDCSIQQDGVFLESQSYMAESITLKFFGEQLSVSLEKQDASSKEISQSKTILSLNSNELLQSETRVNGVPISTQIKDNVFNDYINGISNSSINLFCGDMYFKSGDLAKNWLSGEILQVNDIVYFDNDTYYDQSQRYWRIVGREISKSGVPKLSLELQEVKMSPQSGGLYSDSSFTTKVASWDELIDNGTIIVGDNFSTLETCDKQINGYLKISSNITKIKFDAFYGCNSLYGVEINDSVKEIGSGAFTECLNLQFVKLGNGIKTIEGLFYGCSSLKAITLPPSVTVIEGYSFAECTNLETINLNSGLKVIGNGAFQGCPITTITIPSTVRKINPEAFMGCSELQTATFERLTGWRAKNGSSYDNIDVSNPTINATNLTKTYLNDWINDEIPIV